MAYEKVDVTIIGAGVIGLAVAAEVAEEGRKTYILEKNIRFGMETSSRNSEVIHAGIYYPRNSLKAETCVLGNILLYNLAETQAIAHKKTGKLIVATDATEEKVLEELIERGIQNGVGGLVILSREELKQLEPKVRGVAALLSPSTGIIDSHALMRYLVSKSQGRGAVISYISKVIGIEKVSEGYIVAIEEENFSFVTRVLINCAGLNSDRIAEIAGVNVDKVGYRLHYCKGEYFSVSDSKGRLIRRLIYPVPQSDDTGLGVHVTLNLQGEMRLGPNTRYVDEIDYGVDESQRQPFYEAVVKLLPFIQPDDLQPEIAGIRPKLQEPGTGFRDFVIHHEADKGLE